MRVALIHDHLAQDGGAEKVLKVLCEMFPEAPIYTLLFEKDNVAKNFLGKKIEASIIQRLPGGIKHYKWYMPFMPMAVEFFDLRQYDLVLSNASAFAKGVITTENTLHICYCHTPTRYLWSDTHQYINELKYNKYFKKIISLMLNYFRMWDKLASDRVDFFVANSQNVQRRISKYYRRDSAVVYPPVDLAKFYVSPEPSDFFLIGSRLVPYKRTDIVIEAFKQMPEFKLKVFGDGVDRERLQKIAGDASNIEFLGRVSDEERASLFSKCLAFLSPQAEDFGITPVEAMASGRPVIAYKIGGALETIIEGQTGEFFTEQTPEAIVSAVKNFNSAKYDSAFIHNHATKFSEERFKREMRELIDSEWNKFSVKELF